MALNSKLDGQLRSLSVKNLDNDEEEQIVGRHAPCDDRLLTSSPLFVDQASDLSHISGCWREEGGGRYNKKDKYNLTFNFHI